MDDNFELQKINIHLREHANYDKIKSFIEKKLEQHKSGESNEIISIMKKVYSFFDCIEYFDFHKKDKKHINKLLEIILDTIIKLDMFYSSSLTEKNYNREVESLQKRHQKETSKYNKKVHSLGMKEIEVEPIDFPSHPSNIYIQAINRLKFEVGLDEETAEILLHETLKISRPPITKSIKQRNVKSTEDLQLRISKAIQRDKKNGEISFKSFVSLPELWNISDGKTRKQVFEILLLLENGLPFILKEQSKF